MPKWITLCFLIAPTLNLAQGPQLVLPVGHSKGVTTALFSPDGQYVVTSSDDDWTSKIWEANTGRLIRTLSGTSAVVSADSKYIMTTFYNGSLEDNGTVRIWFASSGALMYTLPAYPASFSPDGKSILTILTDKNKKTSGRLVETSSGKTIRLFAVNSVGDITVKISNTGNYVAITSDSLATIWETSTGKKLRTLIHHSHSILSNWFSPDERYLATSDFYGANVWDIQSGKLSHSIKLNQLCKWVSFSSRCSLLEMITANPDGSDSTQIWDMNSWRPLLKLSAASVYLGPGEKQFVTSQDHFAQLWETNDNGATSKILSHSGIIGQISFSHDRRYLVTSSWDATSKIWDATTGQAIQVFKGHTERVNSASFSEDGKFLATASNDLTAGIWDVATGRLLHQLKGMTRPINSCFFSPDGRLILTATDSLVFLQSTATGQITRSFKVSSALSGGGFSPDSKYLMLASDNKVAKVWDIETGGLLQSYTGFSGFSPDSKYCLTIGGDKRARVQEIRSANTKLILDVFFVKEAVFSPDGRYIGTTNGKDKANLWDNSTGRELFAFDVHEPFGISFSGDGRYFMINQYKDVQIIESATGILIREFEDEPSFSPDCNYVIGSDKNDIRVWDNSDGNLILAVKDSSEVLSLNFTPDSKSILVSDKKEEAIKIVDLETAVVVSRISGFREPVYQTEFSKDGKILVAWGRLGRKQQIMDLSTGQLIGDYRDVNPLSDHLDSMLGIFSDYGTLKMNDLNTNLNLFSWIVINDSSWVVVHPNGLFNASVSMLRKLYFAEGLHSVEMALLQPLYREPDLWKKAMARQKLRTPVPERK